jgi:malonyl-CoA O-methyltransferase
MPEPLASSASPPRRALDESALHGLLRRQHGAAAPWLHGEVARRMAQRLSLMKRQPVQILDWWAAQGGGEAALREACPRSRVQTVEPVGPAETVSSAWWERLWRVPQRPWDEGAVPAGAAELLWSNMMLHWAPDPPAVLRRWHRALAVDGFVMFSCFGPDTLRELRTLFAESGFGPIGVDFIDMHDLGDMLVQAGFADPVMDMETLTLTWDDAARMLAELRGLGHNLHPDRFAGWRTPRWRDRWLAQLPRRADGRWSLSFEIVYGHAFKPLPRVKVADQVSVSLDDMRTMVRQSRPPKRP